MRVRGLVHVHSRYSYDGVHSLEELAAFGRSRGYGFFGMSEHSDTLSEAQMAGYVAECARVSGPDLLVIPGIEFSCTNGLHMVGLGVEHHTTETDPLRVARFIRDHGGVAIVAHPSRYDYRLPDGIASVVDGVEIWNSGYDGRFAPNARSMACLRALRRENPSLLGFGGQDLHRVPERWAVELRIECAALRRELLLDALRAGTFEVANPYFSVDPRRDASVLVRAKFGLVRSLYTLARSLRDYLRSGGGR